MYVDTFKIVILRLPLIPNFTTLYNIDTSWTSLTSSTLIWTWRFYKYWLIQINLGSPQILHILHACSAILFWCFTFGQNTDKFLKPNIYITPNKISIFLKQICRPLLRLFVNIKMEKSCSRLAQYLLPGQIITILKILFFTEEGYEASPNDINEDQFNKKRRQDRRRNKDRHHRRTTETACNIYSFF